MAKRYLRLAKLFLDYIGDRKSTPSDGSDYIAHWRNTGNTVPSGRTGPCTMETMLTMLFQTRHRFRKEVLSPKWDRAAFFMEYQLNQPIQDLMNPFAGLLRDLPKAAYKELAGVSVGLVQMFAPRQSPWTQPALFGTRKIELSNEPVAKSKSLPKPTHKAPSTLQ